MAAEANPKSAATARRDRSNRIEKSFESSSKISGLLIREAAHTPEQILVVEWLVDDEGVAEMGRQVIAAVTGDENERNATIGQYVCDVVNPAADDVHVQQGAMQFLVLRQLHRLGERPHGTDHVETVILQDPADMGGQ